MMGNTDGKTFLTHIWYMVEGGTLEETTTNVLFQVVAPKTSSFGM